MPGSATDALNAPKWREALRLEAADPAGAPAFGLVAPLSALLRRAARLERTAAARGRLMLCLSGARAVLWSVEPPMLPWVSGDVVYLGAPDRRIFTPIGLRVATPPALAPAWLAALERAHGVAPPLLLAPARALGGANDTLSALDLRDSAPLAAVDWSRLAAEAACG